MSAAARLAGIKIPSAHRINKQRAIPGSSAVRRARQPSDRLGRQPTVSPEPYRLLPDPEIKSKPNANLSTGQIKYFDLDISVRTLQRGLKGYTNYAQKYRMTYVSKSISSANRRKFQQHGKQYENETISVSLVVPGSV